MVLRNGFEVRCQAEIGKINRLLMEDEKSWSSAFPFFFHSDHYPKSIQQKFSFSFFICKLIWVTVCCLRRKKSNWNRLEGGKEGQNRRQKGRKDTQFLNKLSSGKKIRCPHLKENEISKHQSVLESTKMLVIIRLKNRICCDVVIIQYMYIKSLSLSRSTNG